MQRKYNMRDVFCFNGFNQTAIDLRYSAHIIIINLFAKAGCQWDNSPSSWPPMIINTILNHNYKNKKKQRNHTKRLKPLNQKTLPTNIIWRNSVVIKHCVLLGMGLQNKGEVAGVSFKFVLFNKSFPNPAKFQIQPNFGRSQISAGFVKRPDFGRIWTPVQPYLN